MLVYKAINGKETSKSAAHLFLSLWAARKVYSISVFVFPIFEVVLVNSYHQCLAPTYAGNLWSQSILKFHLWSFFHISSLGMSYGQQKEWEGREQALQRLLQNHGQSTWSGGDKAWVSWAYTEQTSLRGSCSWMGSPLLTCHPFCLFLPNITSSEI